MPSPLCPRLQAGSVGKFRREFVLNPENGNLCGSQSRRDIDAATTLGTRTGLCLRVDRRHATVAALRLAGLLRSRPSGRPGADMVSRRSTMGHHRAHRRRAARSRSSLARSVLYLAIATVQLVLVLLVAPAATAGSICLDRARGTLTAHVGHRPDQLGDCAGKAARGCCRCFPWWSRRCPCWRSRGCSAGHHRGDRDPDANHRDPGHLRLQSGDGDLGPGDQDARSADGGLRNLCGLDTWPADLGGAVSSDLADD